VATASAYTFAPTMRHPFRLNRRRVLSLGLMLAAFAGGLAYVNGVAQAPTYPVLIAAHDLPRGSVITGNDFMPERVALPDSMAALALPATSAPTVVGQRLAEPVHAGVPLLHAQIAGPTEVVPGFQRIAFPVPPEHAAGGRLSVGDAVRIYVTGGRGKPEAHTTVALDQAVVAALGYQDVGLASSGGGDGSGQRAMGKLTWIEVLVDDARASSFVQSLAAGDPDVAVLPSSPGDASIGGGQ
jgi:Flp pilus assembly protein CpaB